MSFPRYPDYKSSGLASIGNIPSNWTVKPVKAIAQLINGYPFESTRFNPNEGHPIVRIRDLGKAEVETRYSGDFIPEASIDNQDVLIGMDGDFNVGRWLGETPALLNQRVCCVRASNLSLTRYLEYALPAPLKRINEVTYSTTVKHLSSLEVLRIKVSLPLTEEEIGKVVSFLDRETAKIDALIAEQQRLIELLQEKRQSVISHAVTKGLNPKAPMKNSGVEWLGEVPEHWEPIRLKYLTRDIDGIQMGPFGALLTNLESQDTGYKVYGQENIIKQNLELGSRWISEVRFHELKRYALRPRDIVVTRKGSLGNASLIQSIPQPGIGDSDTIRIRCNEDRLSPVFLVKILHEAEYIDQQLIQLKRGSVLPGLNTETICGLVVAVPPLHEQEEIISFISRICEDINGFISKAAAAEALLKERRSALISAAVTGQIDVRGLATEEAA